MQCLEAYVVLCPVQAVVFSISLGMFDRDYNGIDLNEFHSLWNYLQQWRGIFAQFDRDSSGFIDANELHNGKKW